VEEKSKRFGIETQCVRLHTLVVLFARCPKCGNLLVLKNDPRFSRQRQPARRRQRRPRRKPSRRERRRPRLNLPHCSVGSRRGRCAGRGIIRRRRFIRRALRPGRRGPRGQARGLKRRAARSAAAAMGDGAVLCVKCGYDTRTGKKLTTEAVAKSGKAKPVVPGKKPVEDRMAAPGIADRRRRALHLVRARRGRNLVRGRQATGLGFPSSAVSPAPRCGAGMHIGQKGTSDIGGIIAAAITFGSILAAKLAVVYLVLLPLAQSLDDEQTFKILMVSTLVRPSSLISLVRWHGRRLAHRQRIDVRLIPRHKARRDRHAKIASMQRKRRRPKQKRIVIIAGPNGAGKTTYARKFLPMEGEQPDFINADLIALGLSPFAPEREAFSSGENHAWNDCRQGKDRAILRVRNNLEWIKLCKAHLTLESRRISREAGFLEAALRGTCNRAR